MGRGRAGRVREAREGLEERKVARGLWAATGMVWVNANEHRDGAAGRLVKAEMMEASEGISPLLCGG